MRLLSLLLFYQYGVFPIYNDVMVPFVFWFTYAPVPPLRSRKLILTSYLLCGPVSVWISSLSLKQNFCCNSVCTRSEPAWHNVALFYLFFQRHECGNWFDLTPRPIFEIRVLCSKTSDPIGTIGQQPYLSARLGICRLCLFVCEGKYCMCL